ncbi:rod shape-determining protein MreD [Nocardioides sp. Kera G14]|uniref:rod shape-determining protein MreD n=1 Tax=Nocardioides sp. Kera G14 TaxID=2884264 RepID=UPI001D124337|nr:rod shape-determining protein MreD [Nocardioides sp. Kera G14]UDY24494.1 rod shape-determining protein MreD [Nocardioides sp. Kera G14]
MTATPIQSPIDLRRVAPWALAAVLVSVALILQVSVFDAFAWRGTVPDLVLLVVVAGALVRGSHFGLVLGFAAGVLVDLAPPSDHLAGRWALALLLIGYVAGRVREATVDETGRPAELRLPTVLATAVACSFAGLSIFALSGVILRDPPLPMDDLLQPILGGLVWDAVLAALVVPAAMLAFRRLVPDAAPDLTPGPTPRPTPET